LWPIPIYR